MWGPLQNPEHVEFYEDFNRRRSAQQEDWMPMVRAVQHLQSLPVASQLFAFTSLWRFYVTTAPSYSEAHAHREHRAVSIIWQWPHRHFRLSFSTLTKGWVDDWEPHELSGESSFASSVEPLIRRLVESPPPPPSGASG